ncbi:MAG TPA: redoxin domain-containing protein [Acidimicrobiales bacterium]|nr:redoxin domain-containing protein [Acidimicrobiales bacterium]
MSTLPPPDPPGPPGPSRVDAARGGSRFPLVAAAVAALVVVIVVAAVAIVLVGDDDGGTTAGPDPAAVTDPEAGPDDAPSDEPPGEEAFGPVAVEGPALERLPRDGDDPAVGEPAPRLVGRTPGGAEIAVEPTAGPAVIAFVAHWCPHCQAEVPRIVELAGGEADIQGVELVAVATGTDPRAPNYPPGSWLAGEGWPGTVLLDSEEATAAAAYGVTGYPFLVAVDGDGTVVARSSGELGDEGLADFFAEAASAS